MEFKERLSHNLEVTQSNLKLSQGTIKEWLSGASLVWNLTKCEFVKGQVQYLGYILGHDRVCPPLSKVEAISNLSQPQNRKNLQQFLVEPGSTGVLHECVANDAWGEQKDAEPAALRPYFRMRRHLSCQGDIVLYTSDERFPRLVILTALRRTVLANLHAGKDTARSGTCHDPKSVNSSIRHDQQAHSLTPLRPGQRARIQNPSSGRRDRVGTVLELSAPCQYLLRLDGSGRASIRNRRHLRPLTGEPHLSDDSTESPTPVRVTTPRPRLTQRAPRHLDDYFLNSESVWTSLSVTACLVLPRSTNKRNQDSGVSATLHTPTGGH
ncbi:hypothetical protein O3P69_020573 [Scylla paramamosain]|uniref:Uncharacterized protein n=1 Tax=Scylla paramamosain TaxID=85552 RepID=A0AAW0TN15_SCYPA